MRDELIADLKAVHSAHGKISRKLYRVHGTYSENQIRKHFGTFSAGILAAGLTTVIVQEPVSGEETQEFVDNTWKISLPKTQISSLDELVEHCKVDRKVWQVKRFLINKKDNVLKGEVTEPSFNITATFAHKEATDWVRLEIEDLVREAKSELARSCYTHANEFNKKYPIVGTILPTTGYVLEINIPDLHLGKLAWSKETGYKNYDSKIAVPLFFEALNDLLAQVAHYKFDYILFVVGNDLLNADNAEGTTTSGTPQDNDSRHYKTFVTARNMIRDAIQICRKVAPVKVVGCPGNHDRMSAWYLVDSLQMFFEGIGAIDVEVDNSPKVRKYYQYGKNLLMFTHGDTAKREKLPLIMASEEPRMWGDTKYRECHTGHIHQTKTEEYNGVRVRVLPALCPPDAWHASNGFVGNLRVAEAYVWSKEKGLKAEFFYNAD